MSRTRVAFSSTVLLKRVINILREQNHYPMTKTNLKRNINDGNRLNDAIAFLIFVKIIKRVRFSNNTDHNGYILNKEWEDMV